MAITTIHTSETPDWQVAADAGRELRAVVLGDVRQRVDASLARAGLAAPDFRSAVRNVILVASSSRSGSSVLGEVLKRSPRYLHCRGELNPFLHLAGLAWPESGSSSDALTAMHATPDTMRVVEAHLAAEVGSFAPGDDVAPVSVDFAENLYRRLCMQWPLERFTIHEVTVAMTRAVHAVETRGGRRCDWSRDLSSFHLDFLCRLRDKHPVLNPYYYDLPAALIRERRPDVPMPAGPPSRVLIEEPPFILIQPWTRWRVADLATRAVVITAPSNAYRFDFLRQLFPRARFRVLHLTRNPAAAINGLRDGWRHRGFHTHYVGRELNIPGYSEPGMPDHGWWKFDLAPGWHELRKQSLESICGFQWSSAQRAILNHVRNAHVDYRRLRIEDVLGGFSGCPEVRAGLGAWLGDETFLAKGSETLPPVMSTQPPLPGRWRVHMQELAGVLRTPSVRAVAADLGYADEATWL